MSTDNSQREQYFTALGEAQRYEQTANGWDLLLRRQAAIISGYDLVTQYNSSGQLLAPVQMPLSDETRDAYRTALLAAVPDLNLGAEAGGSAGLFGAGSPALSKLLTTARDDARAAMSREIASMTSISPRASYDEYPAQTLEEAKKLGLPLAALGLGFGGGSAPAPPRVASVFTAAGGKVYTVMDNGGINETGLQAPPNTKAEVASNGDLVAFNLDDPSSAPVVLQKGFRFAEVDPMLKFKTETAAAFAGLELQRRGMLVSAQSNFMANEIELGRLTYDEANTNLNRINSAFDQRRKDLDIQLKYAVQRTSLGTNAAGQQITHLPFGADIAKILHVDPSNFDLPTQNINPDATGQAVLDASNFNSPIDRLTQQLAAARAATAGIIGAPMASGEVANTATQAATAGVSGAQ